MEKQVVKGNAPYKDLPPRLQKIVKEEYKKQKKNVLQNFDENRNVMYLLTWSGSSQGGNFWSKVYSSEDLSYWENNSQNKTWWW